MKGNLFCRYLLPLVVTGCFITRSSAQTNVPNGSSRPTVTAVTAQGALSSSTKVNYVRSRDAVAAISDTAVFDTANYIRVKQTTQYMDGLGRPWQTVVQQVSPGLKDIVSPVRYDEYGRESYKYLPYVSTETNGNFKLDPFGAQATFMASQFSGETIYYGETRFENSPLNRPVKSLAPGNSWAGNGKGISMGYLVNKADDLVRIWTITNNALTYSGDASTNIPATAATYGAGQLYETHTADEHDKEVVEYKDKEGKIILKKVQIAASPGEDHTGWLCTYYVYDDFGSLRFVIPPKAVVYLAANSWTFSTDIIAELCFRYEYDTQNRMIAKKVPGAGWVYMVYDKRDRLAFTQDANMRGGNKWLTTIYDDQNRPVTTGMISYAGNRDALQGVIDALFIASTVTTVTVSFYAPDTLYVNERETGKPTYRAKEKIVFTGIMETEGGAEVETFIGPATVSETSVLVNYNPLPSGSGFIPLTVNYYDNYLFTANTYNTSNNTYLNDVDGYPYAETLPSSKSPLTRGMSTGSKVRVIEDPDNLAAGPWISSASFYDDKGRVIQTNTENYKNGADVNTMRYDFSGKVLAVYQVHNNAAAGQTVKTKTNMLYDHAGRLLHIRKTLNNDAGTMRYLSRNEYDELGQLKDKKLGQRSGSDAGAMEPQAYEYNIRGWLRGINQPYTGGGTGSEWFGMELNYDYGFEKNQLNGNIAGTKWRSRGDGRRRAFGYDYDAANRLLSADFNQFTDAWNKTAGIDYTTLMGDGSDHTTAYDENGNIKKMQQKAWKISGSDWIDNLAYTYKDNSNKLRNVIDSKNETGTTLGDFRSSVAYMTALGNNKTITATDYNYDDNGNLTKDNNKEIDVITYNHLNLPYKITVTGKGTITYVYDATGNKLEKRTVETATSKTIHTTYLGGYVYQNDTLQFMSHEEGRIRKKPDNSFVYDYFVKDHLGNTRMVLTEEYQQDTYPVATLESSAVAVEGDYYAINSGNITAKGTITGFTGTSGSTYTNNNGNPPYNSNPTSVTTAESQYLYKLNGSTGNKTGLGTTIRVMSGDTVSIFGKSYWYNNTTSSTNTYSLVVTDLLTALAGTGAVATANKGASSSGLTGSSVIPGDLTTHLGTAPSAGTGPKAYINWILFDEQFRVVSSSSGFSKVSTAGNEITPHAEVAHITKNGYLYVYCSNESNKDVFFDNLQVIHNHGPLLEETHYYPFGLTMAGISSKAAGKLENKYKFGGNELQQGEFSDGVGLEWYDFDARTHLQQIGRFAQIDPLTELSRRFSPYVYGNNNPISFTDPDGMYSVHVNETGEVLQNYDDGDNTVFLHKNKNAKDVDKKYNSKDHSAGGTRIGELGGEIDATEILTNVLTENIAEATDIYSPWTLKGLVNDGKDWDLKLKKGTIWSLANDNKTQFNFGGVKMESQDVGNFHFGAVAKAVLNYLPGNEEIILRQAGKNQMSKPGRSIPEWQKYESIEINAGRGETITKRGAMLPPYGDDPRDQKWIQAGFEYWKKHKK
jgi:RHS repeat-associated protein